MFFSSLMNRMPKTAAVMVVVVAIMIGLYLLSQVPLLFINMFASIPIEYFSFIGTLLGAIILCGIVYIGLLSWPFAEHFVEKYTNAADKSRAEFAERTKLMSNRISNYGVSRKGANAIASYLATVSYKYPELFEFKKKDSKTVVHIHIDALTLAMAEMDKEMNVLRGLKKLSKTEKG